MKKIINNLFIVTLSLLMIVTTSLVVKVKADTSPTEFNNKGFVDKVTVDPNDLRNGTHTVLTAYFSEKDIPVRSGDTLTLSKPDNIELFEISGENTIKLEKEVDGEMVVYGTAVTSPDREQIVITFNENVELFNKFKGEIFFTGKAGWVQPENPVGEWEHTEHYTTSLGTDAPEVPYDISNHMTIGKNPFFYKPNGSVWTTNRGYVVWSLNLNRDNLVYHSDVVITDEFGEGQTFALIDDTKPVSVENLMPNRFIINVYETESRTDYITLTPIEFIDKGYGTIEFDETNPRKFTLTFFKEKAGPTNYYTLTYHAKITEEGKYMPRFYNSATATYLNELGEETIKADLDRTADNIFEGGIIAPVKGSLRIIKLITDDGKSNPLRDVTFKIFHEDGTPVAKLEDIVIKTDATGTFDTPVLDDGKYYITEISAPSYAVFDPNEKFPFEISDMTNTGIALVVHNGVTKRNIDIEKVWEDSLTNHPNIQVNLLADGEIINNVELGENKWTYTFENLPTHTLKGKEIKYTVEEVAVNGYTSIVSGDVENGFTITNNLKREISAIKEASKNEVIQGEPFTYSIIVNNLTENSKTLEDVVVEDILPAGIELTDGKIFIDGVLHKTEESKSNISVLIPTLEFGKAAVVSFEVIATDKVVGEIINTAKVINPDDPENPVEPEVPVVVIPKNAEINASKTVNKSELTPGEVFEYTVTVKNITKGSNPISKVIVKDTLPEGIDFASNQIFVDGKPQEIDITAREFTVIIDNLSYQNDVKITFEAITSETSNGIYVNKAIVTNPEDPENPIEPEVPVTVTPLEAQLVATKTVNKDKLVPGEEFEYKITIKNITKGSLPLKNVKVSDFLPEGIEFTDGTIYLDGVPFINLLNIEHLDLTIPEVKYGKDVVVSFSAKAGLETSGTYINKAKVTNPEDPENPEEPEVPVVVTPDDAQISAEKLVSKNDIKPGEIFTYTIKVKNTVETSLPLKNVTVSDTLPEGIELTDGVIYVNGVAETTIATDNQFTVTIPVLKYGEDVVITFEAKAGLETSGTYINKAKVTNPEDPENPEEPEVPVVVTPDDAQISAEKLVSKNDIKPGEIFTYTIKVKNTVETSLPLKNVTVSDTLPEGIELTDGVIYVNGVAETTIATDNQFTVTIPVLKYGEDVVITFEAKAGLETSGTYINKAKVTNPEDPENPEEPEVPVVVTPDDAQISAEKLVSKNDIKPGEIFTYTIKVKNTVETSLPLKNVTVSDTLPEGIELTDGVIYVNGVAETTIATDNQFTVTIPVLKYGEDVVITFEAKAGLETSGTYINKAKVTNPEDPENPEEPEVPVVVTPDDAQISAEKLVSKNDIKPGEIFTYTIKVKNTVETSLPLKNVTVSDTLPEGIELTDGVIYVNGVAETTIATDNQFTVTIPVLKYGEDVVITFEAKAGLETSGTYINKAKVTNPEDPENPEEPEVPVVVTPDDAILVAVKESTKSDLKPGDIFEYRIILSNIAPQSLAIKNVVVKDVMPEGIELTNGIIYINGEAFAKVNSNKDFEIVVPQVKYGEDIVISFEAKINKVIQGTVINKAYITNPGDPENPLEPEVPVTVTPDKAIVVAEKTVSKPTVKPGEKFEYQIEVRNVTKDSLPVKDIIVYDTLPKGISFLDGNIYLNGKLVGNTTNNYFEVTIPELAYGELAFISFEAIADNDSSGNYLNIATVINPEDPENPIYPEVPVEVTPNVPEPKDPELPGTGIANNTIYYIGLIIFGLFLVLMSLKNRNNKV